MNIKANSLKRVLFLLLMTHPWNLEGEVTLTPYGFVAYDHFYDTRQVVALRDNFVLLFPAPILRDRCGRDINAHPDWNITAIQSRFGTIAESPLPWDESKVSAIIETDFLGAYNGATAEDDPLAGTFRIRYAYLFFDTPRWQFLAGEYWHPLFTYPDCFPDTISYNNGSPVDSASRDPQVRFTYKGKSFECMLAALSQNTFTSPGPCGYSYRYIANAVTPNICAQARYVHDDFFIGVMLDYKRLVPRLVTEKCVATNESINSIIAELLGAYNGERLQIRSKVIYAQNAADQFMLGGYAVETRDPHTDIRTYRNTSAVTGWIDVAYWFDNLTKSVGLFVGAGKNLGASKPLFIDPFTKQPIVYALNPKLDFIFSIYPRMRFIIKPMTIGVELLYTQVAFGELTSCGGVKHPQTTHNVRFLFEILYKF